MEPITYIILLLAIIFAIGLAVYHNKKNQRNIMNYYSQTSDQGFDISKQSIKNQEKMIEILEEISKKLDK